MGHLFSVCYCTSDLVPLLSSRSSKLSSLKILQSSKSSVQDFILNAVIEPFEFCHESVDFFFIGFNFNCCHLYVRGGGGLLVLCCCAFEYGGGLLAFLGHSQDMCPWALQWKHCPFFFNFS